MNEIKARLNQFIEFKGISKREFCRRIDVSSTFLANDSEIASDKVLNIITAFPEIDTDWLISGKGQMTRIDGGRSTATQLEFDFNKWLQIEEIKAEAARTNAKSFEKVADANATIVETSKSQQEVIAELTRKVLELTDKKGESMPKSRGVL